MNPLPDAAVMIQAMIEALDAEDTAAALALLETHDQAVKQFVETASAEPDFQAQLVDLQRLQLALIELLRGRRDAIADELQSLGRGGKATRAYLSESSE